MVENNKIYRQGIKYMLESTFHGFKTPYNIMAEFHPRINGDVVNLWIDGWSVIESFFRDENIEFLRTAPGQLTTMLTPELINIAAHYRNWFCGRSRAPSYVRVFFLFQNTPSELHDLNSDFKRKILDRFMQPKSIEFMEISKMVWRCIKSAKILCRSIPGIYLLETGNLEVDIVPQIISNTRGWHADRNIVLSRSTVARQQVFYMHNCSILDPNSQKSRCWDKSLSHDLARSLVPSNKRQSIAERAPLVDASAIPLLIALIGKKELGVAGIPRFGNVKAFQLLQSLYSEHVLASTWYEYETLVNALENSSTFTNTISFQHHAQVYENLKITLLRYSIRFATESRLNDIGMQLIDAPDRVRVDTLSSQYHSTNPIRTQDLWKIP